MGHVHAFEYFGSVPKTLVPNDVKTGVRRTNFYGPGLNNAYQEMAGRYGAVILADKVRTIPQIIIKGNPSMRSLQ